MTTTTNMTLWQLTKDFIEIASLLEREYDALDEAEGLDLQALEVALSRIQADRVQKIENCLKLYHTFRARERLVTTEITRLRAIEDKLDRCASNLESYLNKNICVGEEFSFGCGAISWRASEAVVPEDNTDGEPEIPMEFQRVKVTPNLAEMKKVLKSGGEIKGWNLIKRNNIQLK